MLDAKLMDAARAYEQSIESRRDRFWGEVWTLFILVAAALVGGSIGWGDNRRAIQWGLLWA